MQSRLPDINTAFIKHRNGVIDGLGAMNIDKIFGSLYSWNSLLPKYENEDGTPKYRVVVSDLLYSKETEVTVVAICNFCKANIDYNKINITNSVTSLLVQILSGNKTSKIWRCSKCGEENSLHETLISESKMQEPYFLGIVPQPPKRKDGLQDRGSYARKVTQWAWNFIVELEESSGRFREDYKENKDDYEGIGFNDDIDGGEK
jgi:hypothetical protein